MLNGIGRGMSMPSRRSVLQRAGLLGLLPFSKRAAAANSQANIYNRLGIRPVINCRGTHTVLGASKIWPELHEAMADASRHYVLLEEVHDKIGARLAELIGAEAAMVTTGCAGAIHVGTCACLTGADRAKVRQLPNLSGMKSEAIIQKIHRNGYDHAVRNSGVQIVEVEGLEQMRNAVNDRTAMMYFLGAESGDAEWKTDPVPLEECLRLGKAAGFPVLVDAANMLPPWDNLRKLASLKTDLICISGGKHMRGPQCSGILAGRKDLVQAARLNSSPYPDSAGRPLKVGREEMVGIWLAAEKYSRLDFAALDRQCASQAAYLERELKKIPGVQVSYAPHDRTRRVYRVVAEWDERAKGITYDECEAQLLEGDPRVAVLRRNRAPMFVLLMHEPGDEQIVARRMREILGRSPAKRS
jgi:D-glucosaminate-6-phosphate ammonia-lyase